MDRKMELVLGRNLLRLRQLQNVPQTKMAKIAGVSQKTISNIENANSGVSPKLQTICQVADYFGIHPSVLLIDNLTDDALTDKSVSLMLQRFVQLAPEHKTRIMDLIGDLWKLREGQ